MLLSALNYVQRDVAQIIVLYEEGAPTVKVRVDTQERLIGKDVQRMSEIGIAALHRDVHRPALELALHFVILAIGRFADFDAGLV